MSITKQINYQVNFNPNTANVQSAVKGLQATLQSINSTPISFDATGLQTAKKDAQELSSILRQAMNTDTGKLDISKFSQQLKQSGKDLSTYATSLQRLGPQGKQAFMQLASSIAQAQVPLRKTNKMFSSLMSNMWNVAKWQISSSILMGFTQGVSNAITYVKELNKNLNDIRIVSEKSAGYMESFAEKANQAAKDLATGTNEYVKASLIYYQQGLSDKEVKERTEATIKMANVTGEAAEQVSSYMTAIWNNFAEGTDQLEYFADVMTRLGAETAASTAEIAKALEKFSGIAETVGLSYEYATSAVTTLIDQTRQSPEMIGTAMKTIFSRLQGLKLGETLEDGTDLNKYSEALAVVGVNIKDGNDQLKSMDTILDELGSKWNLISKDQQMALAQTVGGIRQYTQLITLMDNYDKMKKNIDFATNSAGTLEQQQAIYKESWEATSKEMQASMENLYSSLTPEDSLIELTKGLSHFVDALSNIIESVGGLGPIFMMTFGVLASKYMPQLIQGGMNFVNNLKISLGLGQKQVQNFTLQAQKILESEGFIKNENATYQQMAANVTKILELQNYKLSNADKLTASRKEEIEAQIESLNLENRILAATEQRRAANEQAALKAHDMGAAYALDNGGSTTDSTRALNNVRKTSQFSQLVNDYGMNSETTGAFGTQPGMTKDVNVARGFIKDQSLRIGNAYSASFGVTADQVSAQDGLKSQIDSRQLAQNDERASLASLTMGKGKNKTSQVIFDEQGMARAHGKKANDSKLQERIAEYNKEQKALAALNAEHQKTQKAIDGSEAEFKQLAAALKELDALSENTEMDADELEAAYTELTTKIAGYSNALKNKAVEEGNVFAGKEATTAMMGVGKQGAEGIKKGFQTPTEQSEEDANKNREAFNEAKKQRADAYQQSVQGVTSALSGAYMAMSAIQSLGSLWNNDDLTFGEKMISALMSMSMLVPGLTMAWGGYKSMMEGLAKAHQKKILMTQLNAKGEKQLQKEIVKTEGASDAARADDPIENTQDATTGIIKSFKQAGIPGAIIGGAIAAVLIGTAIAGIAGAISKAKENAAEEKAEEDYKIAEQTIEEVKEGTEKLISYQEALAAYNKETGEGKEELAKQAEALAEAYNIEGAALAKLTGDYEAFNKKVQEKALAENTRLINNTDLSINSINHLIDTKDMFDEGDGDISNGVFKETFDTVVSDELFNLAQENGLDLFSNQDGILSISTDNFAEGAWQLIQLRNLIMQDPTNLAKSEALLEEIGKTLEGIDDGTLDKIITNFSEREENNLSTAFIKTEQAFGKEVKSISDYLDFKDKFIEQAKALDIGKEAAEEYFNSLTQFKEIRDLNATFDELGIEDEERKNYLQELYEQYGSLIFNPVVKPFLEDGTKEELEKQIGTLKVYADVQVYDKGKAALEKYLAGEITLTKFYEEAGITDTKQQETFAKSKNKENAYNAIKNPKEFKLEEKETAELDAKNRAKENFVDKILEFQGDGVLFANAGTDIITDKETLMAKSDEDLLAYYDFLTGYAKESSINYANNINNNQAKAIVFAKANYHKEDDGVIAPQNLTDIVAKGVKDETYSGKGQATYNGALADGTWKKVLRDAGYSEDTIKKQIDDKYDVASLEWINGELANSNSKLSLFFAARKMNVTPGSVSNKIVRPYTAAGGGIGETVAQDVISTYNLPTFTSEYDGSDAEANSAKTDYETAITNEEAKKIEIEAQSQQKYKMSLEDQKSLEDSLAGVNTLESLFYIWGDRDYNNDIFERHFNRIIKEYNPIMQSQAQQILDLRERSANTTGQEKALFDAQLATLYQELAIEEELYEMRTKGVGLWMDNIQKYTESLKDPSSLSPKEIEQARAGVVFEANRVLNTNFFTTDNISTYLPQITAMAKGSETAFMQLQDAIIESWAALEEGEAYKVFQKNLGLTQDDIKNFQDVTGETTGGLEGFRKALKGIFTATGELDAEAFTDLLSGLESTEDQANTVLGILSMFSTVVPDYIETTVKAKVSVVQNAPLKQGDDGNYYNTATGDYTNAHGDEQDSELETDVNSSGGYSDVETQYTQNAAALIKDAHLRGDDYYQKMFAENDQSDLYAEIIQTEDVVQAGKILATEVVNELQHNNVKTESVSGGQGYTQQTVAKNLDKTGVGFLFVADAASGDIGVRTNDQTSEEAMADSFAATKKYLKDFFDFLDDNSGEKTFSLSVPQYEVENFNDALEETKALLQDLQTEAKLLEEQLKNLTPGSEEWKAKSKEIKDNLKDQLNYYKDLVKDAETTQNEITIDWKKTIGFSTIDDKGKVDTELQSFIETLFTKNNIFSDVGRKAIEDAMGDRRRELNNSMLAELAGTNLPYKKTDSGEIVLNEKALMGSGYSGLRSKYLTYQQNIKNLDSGDNWVKQYLEQAETSQKELDDANLQVLQIADEITKSYLDDVKTLRETRDKDNKLKTAEIEKMNALYAETDFTSEALSTREKARNETMLNTENALADALQEIEDLEAVPVEFRNEDWEKDHQEALIRAANAETEVFTKRRETTEAALDDIIGKYEQFNAKLDILITEYENILSRTEDYAYFNKEGKLLDTYATRMTATLDSATAAQEKYTNAQKSYIDVVKKAQEDGVVTNEEQLKIDDAKNTMLEEEGALLDTIKAVYEEITNSLEKYNDELDRNKEKLEAITEITDTYVSILEELGERFNLGEVAQPTALLALQKASVDMAIKNVKVTKEQRDAQKQIVDLIDEELKNYEQGTVKYNELLGIRNEEASKLIELETELASSMSEGITAAAELYSSRIEKIIKNMQDAMAGANYSNMDDLQTAFDRAEEINNLYLDSNEQEYELSKLRRNLNKDLSGNENIYAQQKLKNILEDIEKIEKDKIKLSEYDLKMLNSKYELYKAQIALEEAQNNKTQVRLMRNSQGNWNYVFTADQNKIDQAAQKVEDAQYNIYSQSDEYLKQTQGNIITLQKEWTEAIQAIYEDTSLSLEERQKKINETNEYYATKLAHYGSETTKILDVLDIKFENTTLSLISGYSSVEEIQKATISALTSGFKETEDAVVEFETSVNTAFDNAGIDMQTFADKAVEMADPNNPEGLVGSFDSITKSITTMCSNAITMLSGLMEKLKEVPEFEKVIANSELDLIEADAQFLNYQNSTGDISYKANKDGTFDVTFTGNPIYEGLGTATVTVGANTTSEELHELLKQALGINAFPGEEVQTTTKNKDDNKDNKDNKDNDKVDPQYNKKVQNPVQYDKDEDYAAIIIEGFEEYENSSKTMNAKQRAMSKIFQANNRRNSKIDNEGLVARRYTNEELGRLLDEGKIPQFDTGGYTGNWGSGEGRLAILHEKELILNKEDTAKILSAVEIARTIAGNANLQMFGLANALSGMAKLAYQQEPQTVQQDVHIEATFPGVQSAFEIETALKNIVNDISQYAEIPKE